MSNLRAMLEARSVAVVGASARKGSFGDRLVTELARSEARPELHLVNPRYDHIGELPCVASLSEVPDAVDLVCLAVGDAALDEQVSLAAARGDRSALVFGSAAADGQRANLAAIAAGAGMALCGGGCMGFVNRVRGLRAIGYLERSPIAAGPIALVTHSGSAFSALLRADRRLGWTVAVSSGQELVTTTAEYLEYALDLEETKVVGLLIETLRQPARLRAALDRALEQDVPVVALTVGASPGGRAMVAAHSGALAGDDATWEALCDAHGLLRVHDLEEMADTLELLAAGRRARSGGLGLAAVHDSGAERALAVDVADDVGATFAVLAPPTLERLGGFLDPGLEPGNPLDVWGTGTATRELFGNCLVTLAGDTSVGAVALIVDLVPELDGDEAYREALVDAFDATDLPLCLVTNLPGALDRDGAGRLREHGIPVLEGTRSGLSALRHLLDLGAAARRPAEPAVVDEQRRRHWLGRLQSGRPFGAMESFQVLADYGIGAPAMEEVSDRSRALAAGERIGYPLVLKTAEPSIAHKSDVGGVVLGIGGPDALGEAYDDLAGRLGPAALVMASAPPGTELALGVVHDALVGPVVVVGAGGVLVEVMGDRAVGLPPLDHSGALRLLGRLAIRPLLDGVRGSPPADLVAVADAVVACAQLATELGPGLAALDVNPLRCGQAGALALDALVAVEETGSG